MGIIEDAAGCWTTIWRFLIQTRSAQHSRVFCVNINIYRGDNSIYSQHLVWGANCLNGVSPADHAILPPSREHLGRAYKSIKLALSLETFSKSLRLFLKKQILVDVR